MPELLAMADTTLGCMMPPKSEGKKTKRESHLSRNRLASNRWPSLSESPTAENGLACLTFVASYSRVASEESLRLG